MYVFRQSIILLLFTLAFNTCHAAKLFADMEEVRVVESAPVAKVWDALNTTYQLNQDLLQVMQITHPQEAFSLFPGVWIGRNSGQEHLTALRSPVLTGAGACGSFQILENGIPIRPKGFCNANNLFEVNIEQANLVDVIVGPASGVYGGNALHGLINVSNFNPDEQPYLNISSGPHDYYNLQTYLKAGDSAHQVGIKAAGTQDNGFRDESGYDQQFFQTFFYTPHNQGHQFTSLNYSNLNQETAGYIMSADDPKLYENEDIRLSNPNPEAYRDAMSVRLASHWQWSSKEISVSMIPYARWSEMDFIQHYIFPVKPLEENGHWSIGIQTTAKINILDRHFLTYGVELEKSSMFLKEFQTVATNEDSPSGFHYDFSVDSLSSAIFADLNLELGDRWHLINSLRYENLGYSYQNNMLDGATDDQGNPCLDGGLPIDCKYNRPADRDDQFANWGGRTGVVFDISPQWQSYLSLGSGFRAPQTVEVYRLNNLASLDSLKSERLNAVEWGTRLTQKQVDLDFTLFVEDKNNYIYRDSNNTYVSRGKLDSQGAEWQVTWFATETDKFIWSWTYAEHKYDFTRDDVVQGKFVDTAPKQMGQVMWIRQWREQLRSVLQWQWMDEYFLEPSNTYVYDGHQVLNAALAWKAANSMTWQLKLNNITNELYADRADYGFGRYRFLPAREREILLGVKIEFD